MDATLQYMRRDMVRDALTALEALIIWIIENGVVNAVLYHYWISIKSYDIVAVYFLALGFTIAWLFRTGDKGVCIALFISLLIVISFISMADTFSYTHAIISFILMFLFEGFEPFYVFKLYIFGKRCWDVLLSASKKNLMDFVQSGSFKVSSSYTNVSWLWVLIYIVNFYNPAVQRITHNIALMAGVMTPVLVFNIMIIISNFMEH